MRARNPWRLIRVFGLLLALVVVWDHPILLIPIFVIGVPLAFLIGAGRFVLGLWRLVVYGGREARDQYRRS